MEEWNPWIDFVRLVAAGVLGGLIATFAGHRLTVSRDRQSGIASRKREFLKFAKAWRVEIRKPTLEGGGWGRDTGAFLDHKSEYTHWAESIRPDFSRKNRDMFNSMDSALMEIGAGKLNRKGGHEYLLDTLDKLIKFVESH